jgi:hypothetical protein
LCAQSIDELKVAIEAHDEKYVALRRLTYELQRSLKSASINNNVLLKHMESSIQNKAPNPRSFFAPFCDLE